MLLHRDLLATSFYFAGKSMWKHILIYIQLLRNLRHLTVRFDSKRLVICM